MSLLERVAAALAPHGLVERGGFAPVSADGVPPLVGGAETRTLVLVGDVGGRMWSAFSEARPTLPPAHPLDAWTRRILDGVAQRLGAVPLYPFGGPPHLPFQRWAQRAEPVTPSPIGILIHPEFGLWHAYRGGLAFADAHELPPRRDAPSPCSTCRDRPCLTACPVGAFGETGYDVPACVRHVTGGAGADCRSGGCLARRACPVGREHANGPDQAAFHMTAFLAARRSA
ncbi:MAG: hypothetical protein EXQ94_13540 [Alphaproteobacteria bacterium]|nr:hypothetical protein [Alphaproteobacteria bacterium]